MSHSHDEKDGGNYNNSEWEDSLDAAQHAILTHSESIIHGNDSEVIRRFLVTKDRPLFATGTTTKYLEVLHDSSVRIRDVKKSTYSDPIREPWNVFKKDAQSHKSSKNKNSKSMKLSSKINDNDDNNDNCKVYMDGKAKKRYFKFSTKVEKNEFFDLINKLKNKKNKSMKKQKYTSEPFIFAPYEVVGFFIRNSIVHRQGSTIKYRDKLIAKIKELQSQNNNNGDDTDVH